MEEIFGLIPLLIAVVFAIAGASAKKKAADAKKASEQNTSAEGLPVDAPEFFVSDTEDAFEDDFIPSESPAESYRPMQTAEVNNTRPIYVPAFEEKEPLKVVETPSVCNEIRQELEDAETLRRAVIYQEILTPKFKNS